MKELPGDALTELVGRAPVKNSELGRLRILREPFAIGDDLIVIRSGLAWLYKVTSGGQVQVVALRFPGDLVLPGELKAGYGVQTLVASKVVLVPERDLTSVGSEYDACRMLLSVLERQHAIALQWLIRGTFEAAGKVAHLLCEMAVRSGYVQERDAAFSVPLTQEQIGAITGQTSVNVNRVLAGFEREGLIGRDGPKRYTADWTALRKLGRFDPAYLL